MIALLAAATAAPALMIAQPSSLLIADGTARNFAHGEVAGTNYQPLMTTPDGNAVVAYRDGAFTRVEEIRRDLAHAELARVGVISLIGPATDGFVTYGDGLVRRYGLDGHLNATPAAVLDVRAVIGLRDITVTAGQVRLSAYGRNGHLVRGFAYAADSPVALGDDRFAVIDRTQSLVRVYSAALDELAALRFPGLTITRLAAALDGTLAVVLNGSPLGDRRSACGAGSEIDEFTDLASDSPAARIGFAGRSIGPVALDTNAMYVATETCGRVDDVQIGVIGRDGKASAALAQVGVPTALLSFGPR